jgi:hypothetical protein
MKKKLIAEDINGPWRFAGDNDGITESLPIYRQ